MHSIISLYDGATEIDKLKSSARDRLAEAFAVHCSPSPFIHLSLFFSSPSHWWVRVCLSPPPLHCLVSFPRSSFTCPIIQIAVYRALPPPLHSVVKHWLHSHVLLHTFTNPWRQAISGYFTAEQHTNPVTLRDVGTQASVHTYAHIHRHTYFFLLGFYQTKMFCVLLANKPSSNKSKDGICCRQETAQFIYRFINVWMQRS